MSWEVDDLRRCTPVNQQVIITVGPDLLRTFSSCLDKTALSGGIGDSLFLHPPLRGFACVTPRAAARLSRNHERLVMNG
jgi:hypothetical protein